MRGRSFGSTLDALRRRELARCSAARVALLAAVVLAVAATLITGAQRALSTPVRRVRRRATSVEGRVTLRDGTALAIDRAALLGPSETALRYLSWAMVVLALAAVLARSGV